MPVATADIDMSTVDSWAVDIAVRGHARMNLNHTERIVATLRLKREQGLSEQEIADVLRCSVKEVKTMIRRAYARPKDTRRRADSPRTAKHRQSLSEESGTLDE